MSFEKNVFEKYKLLTNSNMLNYDSSISKYIHHAIEKN
jgi:hypothetical protein